MLSTHHTDSLFHDMHRMADRMRRQMEHDFRETFRSFEEMENQLSLPFSQHSESERALDFPRESERSQFPSLGFRPFEELERSFGNLKDFEDVDNLTPPKLEDEEHTYYKMKVMTNHNGHVKTKSMQKEPGKDWQVKMEEFYQNRNPAIEGNKKEKKRQAICQ